MVKDRQRCLPEGRVRSWAHQMLQGLAFMHTQGYFHRCVPAQMHIRAPPALLPLLPPVSCRLPSPPSINLLYLPARQGHEA